MESAANPPASALRRPYFGFVVTGFYALCASFAVGSVSLFEHLTGRQILCGLPEKRFYETISINIPLIVASIGLLFSTGFTLFKVARKSWPKREVVMIVVYVVEFLFVVVLLLILDFSVFD